MAESALVERIWWGRGIAPTVARAALLPLEAAYRAVVAARGALYDAGMLPARELELPAISIGNLTVGGTGKTPIAAFVAAELVRRGARPAVVLRGYGGDEPLVHATLNPAVPVVVEPDRVKGAEQARSLGADVVVLDDAFQHRRARREADVVLVSADRWTARQRLLPAGPWREPLAALGRASLVIVTRKAASPERAEEVRRALAAAAPGAPLAIVHLAPGELRAVNGTNRRELAAVHGRRVLAISAIGDPGAFVAQLETAGGRVESAVFPDHHGFSDDEVRSLAARAVGADIAVCTLKDAVKLAPAWPRAAPPLWYVSQLVRPERGGNELDRLLEQLLRARRTSTIDDAGRTAGATSDANGH